MEMFFRSIVREDRNLLDLMTADYTFVNERLARHYGIPNIYGSTRYYLIGVACTLVVGLLSLYVGAVLDPDIAGWAATAGDEATRATFAGDGPPASVHGLVWNRWDAINLTRTLAAVAALTSFILANVQRRVFDREG
jgi:hypothetical protein